MFRGAVCEQSEVCEPAHISSRVTTPLAACDNLRCDADGQPPNPLVVVMTGRPAQGLWTKFSQTEIVEVSQFRPRGGFSERVLRGGGTLWSPAERERPVFGAPPAGVRQDVEAPDLGQLELLPAVLTLSVTVDNWRPQYTSLPRYYKKNTLFFGCLYTETAC